MEDLRECRIKMKDIMPEREWQKSGLTCLAARPGMGKTALALDFMLDAVLWMGKPILWFSLEMSTIQMAARVISNVSGTSEKISEENLSTLDKQKLEAAADFLENTEVLIDDTPAISVSEVEEKVKELEDVGLVVIDYVQLMKADDTTEFKNRKEEAQYIVKNLSRIAKERQVPILMLAQLTRSIDYREDKRPCLDDLHRDIVPEDVDQVIFLYREGYYERCDSKEKSRKDSAEIILAKSKSGVIKTVRAQFNQDSYSFEKAI